MALFGDKCSRCNRRTRHSYDGTPTCEACEQEIKARLSAAREAARLCPMDQVSMEKEVVIGLVIDRCPECKGVWLDAGELEQIRRTEKFVAANEMLKGMAYPLG